MIWNQYTIMDSLLLFISNLYSGSFCPLVPNPLLWSQRRCDWIFYLTEISIFSYPGPYHLWWSLKDLSVTLTHIVDSWVRYLNPSYHSFGFRLSAMHWNQNERDIESKEYNFTSVSWLKYPTSILNYSIFVSSLSINGTLWVRKEDG